MAEALTGVMVAIRGKTKPLGWGGVVRFLRSREMALLLLMVILGTLVLGTLIPQSALTVPREYQAWKDAYPFWSRIAEALGLTQVYQSWWFLSLLSVLFLSLLVCTITRVGQIWKMDRVRHREERGVPMGVRMAFSHKAIPLKDDGEEALDDAEEALSEAGYHVRWGEDGEQLFAEKGRYGVWGSVVLHLGFMIVLLGGVYSGAGKMGGYFELAEGQVFTDQREGYIKVSEGPLFGGKYQGFQVRLDQLHTDYWDNNKLRSMASALTLRSPQGEMKDTTIGVDRPLSYQGVNIYQIRRYGFAALFALKDAQGNVVASGYVNFPTPKERTLPSNNRFPIPKTSLRAEADFYPAPGTAPLEDTAWLEASSNQPWLYLFIRDEENQTLYQGPLAQGEAAPAGEYSLSFLKASRWAAFTVLDDPGIPVIYAGFILCILGAAITYLWIPKRVWVWVEASPEGQPLLCMGGRADKNQPAMMEEVRELAAQLGGQHGRP